MTELYWITRLDSIVGVFSAVTFFSSIATTILSIIWFFGFEELSNKRIKHIKRTLMISFSIFFVSLMASTFIPTTKEACAIYGIGGTIDYLKTDSIANKLPHKVIVAIDNYLEEVNTKNIKKKNKKE